MSTYLANLLISRTALFIGYSLDDPDFRAIWQVVKDRLGRLAVLRMSSPPPFPPRRLIAFNAEV